jgi:hypothetical protein
MIVQINGSSTLGKWQLHRVLRRELRADTVYTQTPLPGQRSTHFIQLDSHSNPPFPFVVVTANRGAASHTFCVFGEFWAERAAEVLMMLFPELRRPTVHERVYGRAAR